MMNETATALHARVEAEFLKRETGPYLSWDPVNMPMIRQWCEAMGDANPAYSGAAAMAPPTMLQAWTMRGYNEQRPPVSSTDDPFAILSVFEDAGYPAIVAVNCEQEYFSDIVDGDEIRFTSQIEHISEEKTTGLGTGFFVTELSRHYNQKDELVAEMRFRVFRYRPNAPVAAQQENSTAESMRIRRLPPLRNGDNDFFWEGAAEGKLLIQRCTDCATLRHPPGPMCPQCQSMSWDTVESCGRGVIYSFVVMHYPEIPPFEYPNPIALIELEEGTRLVTQLLGIRPRDVEIGMAVQVEFEEVEEGLVVPQFRPVND